MDADFANFPKVTSRDENAGNTDRFCAIVVTTDMPSMTLLGYNVEFISQTAATSQLYRYVQGLVCECL